MSRIKKADSVRLFSPIALQALGQVALDSGQSRYLTRALRLRVGDSLTLFDGRGGEYGATLIRANGNEAVLETGEHRDRCLESPFEIWLVQGISKGDRMDTLIQKATELGVTRVTPVFTDRTVVRLDAKRAAGRQQHWLKIAQSACEQCGRNRVPNIDEVTDLSDWHDDQSSSEFVRLILKPDAPQPLASITPDNQNTILLIGPEGGFCEAEYDHAANSGFHAVSLGPRILRTETAAIAAVTAIQTLWGDMAGQTGRAS